MKIKNVWSLVALTSIVLAVTACSGTPVVEKKKTTVSAKKLVKTTAGKRPKIAKKIVKRVAVKKAVVVANQAKVKKKSSSRLTSIVKGKPLTAAQSRAKERSIASLGKSRKEQARLKYARAQAARKKLENQKLKRIQLARNNAIKRNNAKRSAYVANWSKMQTLGLDRFSGSQADRPVVNRSAQQARIQAARTAAIRRQQAQKRNALMVASRKRQAAVRSRQPVKARARQLIRTRSRQPVATRAKQPVRARARQPVVTRARQPVRTRARQPVRTRAVQYAARAKTPIRRVSAARRPVVTRRAVVNRPTPRVRKAVYKRPAKRRAVSRIDPNVSFGYALSGAAIERTKQRVRYDGKYVKIGYPWGDVPKSIGVCTDVVIRAYRRLGIDLQSEVHKDITKDFYAYPNLVKWGLTRPDPNIDHRRVYNLQAFFKRHKAELPRSRNPRDYKVGDLVTWMVGPNFPHIGVVVNKPSKADPNRLMIAHNIGYGPKVEDILFRFPMTGHYRYTPKNRKINPALLFAKTPPPASVKRRQRSRGLSYAEILQASKILSGKAQARSLPNINDLLAKGNSKTKPREKIMLAHLDATIFGQTGLNQEALKALLK